MWVLYKINAGSIYVVVCGCNLREFICNSIKCALPQIAGEGKHVCLVYECEMFAIPSCSQLECVAHAALYSVCCVYASLSCNFLWRAFTQYAAFANIRAFRIFANHNEVMRRGVSGCRACKWATIDIQVQLKTHLEQQPALNYARRYTRRANRAEQDGIKIAQLRKRLVRQHFAVAQISRATQIEIACLKVGSSSTQHFERLNYDLWANAVTTNNCNAMLLARLSRCF